MVIQSNKVSIDKLEKTLSFFFFFNRCVLKATRRVNMFRSNHHLL